MLQTTLAQNTEQSHILRSARGATPLLDLFGCQKQCYSLKIFTQLWPTKHIYHLTHLISLNLVLFIIICIQVDAYEHLNINP